MIIIIIGIIIIIIAIIAIVIVIFMIMMTRCTATYRGSSRSCKEATSCFRLVYSR